MNLDDLRRLGQTPAPPNAFASSLAASSVAKATTRLARLRTFSVVGAAAAVVAAGVGMSIFTTRSTDVSDPPLSSSTHAGSPSDSAEPVAPSEPIAPSSPNVSSLPSLTPSGTQSVDPSQIPTKTATPQSNPSQDSPESDLIVIISQDGVGTQTDTPDADPAPSDERTQPDEEETSEPSHTPPANSTPEPDPPAPGATESPDATESPGTSSRSETAPSEPAAPPPSESAPKPTPSASASNDTPVQTPPLTDCKVSDMGTEYLEDQLDAGQNGDVATLSVVLINKGENPCWIRGATRTTFRESDGQQSDGMSTKVNSLIQPGKGLKASVTYSVCDPSKKGATVTLQIGHYGPYRWRDTYGRGC